MKILSVNVGLPREVLFGKDIVTTGIFKEPVEGRVKLRKLNLDGDKQADLTVHGGEGGICISQGALRVLAARIS
jgi:MOSC domain-containing protein YiiM